MVAAGEDGGGGGEVMKYTQIAIKFKWKRLLFWYVG